MYIMVYRMEEWRMDMNGTLPHDLQNRGLSDDRVLPNYAYRDDAMKLYNCIKRYVSSIVNHYYGMLFSFSFSLSLSCPSYTFYL